MPQDISIIKKLPQSANNFISFTHKVALISIAIGNIALLLSLSILEGFDTKLLDTARKFTSDICVQAINGSNLIDIEAKIKSISKFNEVTNITPVIRTEAIVSTASFTEGVVLQSIYDKNDSLSHNYIGNSSIQNNIVAGELNFTKDSNEIVIGQVLAKKLNVKIGDKLLLYAIKDKEHISFSSATYSAFKIKAIYNTGMHQYDNSVIFMSFSGLAGFLEFAPNTTTYLEISIKDLDKAAEVATRIDQTLGFPVFSVTYYDINRSIFAWIELQKEPIPLVLAIISIVASMNIITMLIIIIVEKTNSIGILRTLGLTRRAIVLIFTRISLRVALIGAAIGIGLSAAFAYLQTNYDLIELDSKIYYVDSLPINLEWQFVVIVGALSIIFSLISAIIPSIIAVRISPIKTIRFK